MEICLNRRANGMSVGGCVWMGAGGCVGGCGCVDMGGDVMETAPHHPPPTRYVSDPTFENKLRMCQWSVKNPVASKCGGVRRPGSIEKYEWRCILDLRALNKERNRST
eukprot:1158697-Pelagomonas_calceolata.AAC.6